MNRKHFGLLCLTVLLLLLSGCREKEIKIGFTAALSGRQSAMGISEKHGVTLAIEEMNDSRGPGEALFTLYALDDANDPAQAVQNIKDLKSQGVTALIGPMTSTISTACLETINSSRLVSVSPTSSAASLTNPEDYFFRISTTVNFEAEMLSRFMDENLKVKTVSEIYDPSNSVYTVAWLDSFEHKLPDRERRVLVRIPYSPDDIADSAEELLAQNPDAVLIATGALDAALLMQEIRKRNRNIPVLINGWAKNESFLVNGGPGVEGSIFIEIFNPDSQTEAYLSFKDKFIKRFGYEPGFAETQSYDALLFLQEGLNKQASGESLRDSLASLSSFEGLQGTVQIGEDGDVHRPFHIVTVRDRRFVSY
ncbi:MAG: ABC transporter substrate-binding protein [Spirochaetales bacterium]|nr:ABC transporter substrate-binding protein [Spirochaetales bacterium]